jgi:hypothetical protein
MPTFDGHRAEASREHKWMATLVLDACTLTFGTGACTATGPKCYNTYDTCRDRANYAPEPKRYRYTTHETPFHGPRQLVREVRLGPTAIHKDKTQTGRAYITCNNALTRDTVLDKYIATRPDPLVEAPEFTKLKARHRDSYEGRPVEIREGFDDLAEADWRLAFVGQIEKFITKGSTASIEAPGLGRDLSKVKPVAEISVTTITEISASSDYVPLSSIEEIPVPGVGETLHLAIDEKEIVGYTGVDTEAYRVTGVTRGLYGTAAVAHARDVKVGLARVYDGHPFDIIKDQILLGDAGYPSALIDTASFAKWRDFPDTPVDFQAVITDTDVDLQTLIFEIVDLLEARFWENEDGQLTIRRNVHNEPGKVYEHFTDAAASTVPVVTRDLDERHTSTWILWNRGVFDDHDEARSYSRVATSPDVGLEGEHALGRKIPYVIRNRWHRRGMATDKALNNFNRNAAIRKTWRLKLGPHTYEAEYGLEKSHVRVGDYVWLSTSHILNADTSPYDREAFEVVYRERLRSGRIRFKFRECLRSGVAYIAPNDTPKWSDASVQQRRWYGFIFSDDLLDPDPDRHTVMY